MKSERRSFPRSARSGVARKQPPSAQDVEKLLHFSRQLYAHALTLQEVIRNHGEVSYEVLKPRYDQQAAQQFEISITPSSCPQEFADVARSLANSDLSVICQ